MALVVMIMEILVVCRGIVVGHYILAVVFCLRLLKAPAVPPPSCCDGSRIGNVPI